MLQLSPSFWLPAFMQGSVLLMNPPTFPVPRCGPYRPAGQVGCWKRQIGIKTFGVNNKCAVKLLSLLPLLSCLEVLVCGLAVCVEDLTSCRGWFIIVCLVRGLQAQPISCFMSFVYGFGLILSEKQERARFFPFLESPFVASGVFLTTRGCVICAKWFCFLTSSWKRWNSLFHIYVTTITPCCWTRTCFSSASHLRVEIMWWAWDIFPTAFVIDCRNK